MSKVRLIEFRIKPRQLCNDGLRVRMAMAPVVTMDITEEEAKDHKGLMYTHSRMLNEEGINMKFIVIPSGVFLPVPASHYR